MFVQTFVHILQERIKAMKELSVMELTQELVSIPSYCDTSCDDSEAAAYVLQYLQQFPYLTVMKQMVTDRRFNVIARTPGKPRLLLAGHLDTVQPKTGGQHDPLSPTVVDG